MQFTNFFLSLRIFTLSLSFFRHHSHMLENLSHQYILTTMFTRINQSVVYDHHALSFPLTHFLYRTISLIHFTRHFQSFMTMFYFFHIIIIFIVMAFIFCPRFFPFSFRFSLFFFHSGMCERGKSA